MPPLYTDRHVEGVVQMMMDRTQNYREPPSKERLIGWHAALVPSGHSAIQKIVLGAWRDDAKGPMPVVSGPMGRETLYETPPADKVDARMKKFIAAVNREEGMDPVLQSAIAHLCFVTIHLFDDGNGRIAARDRGLDSRVELEAGLLNKPIGEESLQHIPEVSLTPPPNALSGS